ncbi:MAG: substrate-binding domain-containing protein, partial [Clostridiales bacterium]|nr:substrate-binding domain-containing protein [Clostridiales bacterium]
MRFKLLSLVVVLLCLVLLFGCPTENSDPLPTEVAATEAPTEEPTALPTATPGPTPYPNPYGAPEIHLYSFPAIDGSTATIPLTLALMQASLGCSLEEAEARLDFSTTDYSYYALAEGDADLLLVYEASGTVKKELDLKNNADLFPIGKDALVFIVNADNPVDSLTTKQIQDIYSGKIKNWKQVGGEDKPIVAFQRPELSGSQTMLQKLV